MREKFKRLTEMLRSSYEQMNEAYDRYHSRAIARQLVDNNEEDDERISKENKLNKGEES